MDEYPGNFPGGNYKSSVQIKIGPEVWLSERPFKVAVTGNSMCPFLREGDEIEVIQTEVDTLNPGDLLLFERNGEPTVHRLLARKAESFLEKGDGQAMGNWQPWPEKLGKVIRVKHTGEWINLPTNNLSRKLARLNLIRHRINAVANKIPTSLARRIFLRLARPLIKSRPEENWETNTNKNRNVQKLHTPREGTND